MSRKIFVNLPVKDLGKSVDFFTQLGFEFDPNFTDESATCMIVSDEAFVMLLVEDRFKDFTKKDLCDANAHGGHPGVVRREQRAGRRSRQQGARRRGSAVERPHG